MKFSLLALWMYAVSAPIPTHAFSANEPREISTLLTIYASPNESDFADTASEEAIWYAPGSSIPHKSLFARGFTGRHSVDPINPRISGVAMEGSGWISPELHANDSELMKMLRLGYKVLNVDHWDSETQTATFVLAKAPLGSAGNALEPNVSAAVRKGNPNFPHGSWVKITIDGRLLGYRRIDDHCPACDDTHIDLYQDSRYPGGTFHASVIRVEHPPSFMRENGTIK